MKYTKALLLAAASSASAQMPFPDFSGDPFQKYTLSAKGINASWIPYGARLTSLFVEDCHGEMQDVVLGYDNGTQYLDDTEHPHTYFGAVVGRYANRIKNGTFTIDGETSHIPENEHNGTDTLHGGFIGYDQRNWTVAAQSDNSITFMLYDKAYQGFPGDVVNIATYTLTDAPAFISRMVSIPLNKATPIMLANHIYWNLGAFVSEDGASVLNQTLYMPYADRFIDIDTIEIPTGNISLTNGTALDFTSPMTIGSRINDTTNGCGLGCTGYDNAFILDRPRYSAPNDPGLEVMRLYSPATGIQMSLETNQQGLQLYSCNGENGTIVAKESQQHGWNGTNPITYGQYGCTVWETQDWIDGINFPEWGRDQWQVFSPTSEPALNYAKYSFSAHSA